MKTVRYIWSLESPRTISQRSYQRQWDRKKETHSDPPFFVRLLAGLWLYRRYDIITCAERRA